MKRKKNLKAIHFTNKIEQRYPSKTTIIPVEIVKLEDHSYHLITSVEINGIKGDIIIDTGASVTVIDKNIIPEMTEKESHIEMQSGSVTGDITNVQVIKSHFKIGGRIIKEMQIASIDLNYVNKMYNKHLNRKIIGLLGCDFCVKHNVIIDYRKKILICHF